MNVAMYGILYPKTMLAVIIMFGLGVLLTVIGVFVLMYKATHPKDGLDIRKSEDDPNNWQ